MKSKKQIPGFWPFVYKARYIIFLLFLTLIFYNQLLLHPGQVLYPLGDASSEGLLYANTFFYGFDNFGQFPLWNNFLFSGMPLIGNPVASFFYPPNLLFFLIPNQLFISISFVIQTFLAGLFTYLFAKEIGISRFGSFASGITFMFSTAVVGKIYPGHWSNIMVITLMPLAFLMLERLLKNMTLKNAVFFGIAWAVQLLASNPHFFYFSSMALFLYALFRLVLIYNEHGKKHIKPWTRLQKPILLVGLGLVICLMLSAVYLLPMYDLTKHSIRKGGLNYLEAIEFSLPPRQLITLFIPSFFGKAFDSTYWGEGSNPWGLYIYTGILPLILGLIALLLRKTKHSLFFGLLAGLSLIFGLGRYTPLYRMLFIIPGVSMFRFPAEQFFIFSFAVSILAGTGAMQILDSRFRQDYKKIRAVHRFLIVAGIISLVFSVGLIISKDTIVKYGTTLAQERYAALHGEQSDFSLSYLPKINVVYNHISKGAMFFSVLVLLSSLIIWSAKRKTSKQVLIKCGVILIILIDLWAFSLPSVMVKSPLVWSSRSMEIIGFLKQDHTRFRVFDKAYYLPQQLLPIYEIEKINGHDPTILAEYEEYVRAAAPSYNGNLISVNIDYSDIGNLSNPLIIDMLNTKYIISEEKIENIRYRLVYENKNYMPEKEYDTFKLYSNKTLPLYIYENNNAFPRAYVVYNETSMDKAEIKFYSPNKIVVNADMRTAGYLVLSEIYYPGWKAEESNKQIQLFRFNNIFRSVYLEKGLHTVEFEFMPSSFAIGKTISIVTLFIIGSYLLYMLVSRK